MSFVIKGAVFDTSVLVSAALYPQSTSAQALLAGFAWCRVFRCEQTVTELRTVLNRSKFDRYFSTASNEREQFLRLYLEHSEAATLSVECSDCSDPKDNVFLSLALSVGATYLISGDKAHLLSMDPYRGLRIVSTREFVGTIAQQHGP